MSESPKGFKNFAQNEKSLGDFVTCDMKRGGVCGYSRCTYYIIFIYLFNDQLQYSLHGQRIIYNEYFFFVYCNVTFISIAVTSIVFFFILIFYIVIAKFRARVKYSIPIKKNRLS